MPGEAHRHHAAPGYVEVIRKAHELGLAGATAWRGSQGFGPSSRLERAVVHHPPVAVTIVDQPDRLTRLLEKLGAVLEGAVVVRRPVEIVTGRADGPG
jgi:hypothetical protein